MRQQGKDREREERHGSGAVPPVFVFCEIGTGRMQRQVRVGAGAHKVPCVCGRWRVGSCARGVPKRWCDADPMYRSQLQQGAAQRMKKWGR